MSGFEKVDVLWHLVYDTFERRNGDVFRTSMGGKAQTNEVQFRLMKQISLLKQGNTQSEAVKGQIEADVNLCHAMGWMTDETFEKIDKILGEL